MPVRSLSSVVFKWPNREQVLAAAGRWAAALRCQDRLVEHIYCVGSYARGDWGVGSDLDVIVIVKDAPSSVVERRRRYEPADVLVAADVWVYTREEWESMRQGTPHLWDRLHREMIELGA